MGVLPDWIQGAVRFSQSRYTTETEVGFVNQKLPPIVQRLSGLSALGKLAKNSELERGNYGDQVGARR